MHCWHWGLLGLYRDKSNRRLLGALLALGITWVVSRQEQPEVARCIAGTEDYLGCIATRAAEVARCIAGTEDYLGCIATRAAEGCSVIANNREVLGMPRDKSCTIHKASRHIAFK